LQRLAILPHAKSFLRLAELRGHENETIREKAEYSYQEIRERFSAQLTASDKDVRKHIRRWLEPIWDELAFTKKELKREKYKRKFPSRKAKKISAKRVLKLVENPNTPPRVLSELFYYSDWHSIPAKKRERLTRVFLQHPDSIVRTGSAGTFSAWGDQTSLVKLLSDPEFYVRKKAMYCLGETPPFSNKIAKIAWKHLKRRDAVGTHGWETLSTYVSHAKHKKAVPRLVAIAQDEERPESLRDYAIIMLSHHDEPEVLIGLMKLLEDEPPLTWAMHVALLDHAKWMGYVPPNLKQLQGIDHLHIQVMLAPFFA
jgi:hypothetical protein